MLSILYDIFDNVAWFIADLILNKLKENTYFHLKAVFEHMSYNKGSTTNIMNRRRVIGVKLDFLFFFSTCNSTAPSVLFS